MIENMTNDTEFKVGDKVFVALSKYDPFYAGYHLKRATIVSTEEPDSHYTRGTGHRVLFEDGTTVRVMGHELRRRTEDPVTVPVPDTPKKTQYAITVDVHGLDELVRIVALHAWDHDVSESVRNAILSAKPVPS
jgi:hypothetical protein